MNKNGSFSPTFDVALDRLVAQWPADTQSSMVTTDHGTTHVLSLGGHGVPLVLIPGGGATGASWRKVAERLSGRSLIALDILGDAGRSTPTDGRLKNAREVHDWLDGVRAKLGVAQIDLAGHSYGGWIALSYALARPDLVRRLSLVSPSMCFSGMSPSYIARALPVVMSSSQSAARRLITWETAGLLPDPAALDVYAYGSSQKWCGVLRPSKPRLDDLKALRVDEVHLVLAEADRSQDNTRCEAVARRNVTNVDVVVASNTSHHNVVDLGAETIATILAD